VGQYGFLIDLSRCIGCNACLISCKQWHDMPPGPVKWIRVYQWERGSFPDIELRILPIPCFHCQNPVCIDACPNHAIYKEENWGAVIVDPEKCTGTRECWKACPYGVPQFEGDQPGLKMSKCNMCIDRLKQGLNPICVLSCSMRALEFGPIDELIEKYGEISNVYPPKVKSGESSNFIEVNLGSDREGTAEQAKTSLHYGKMVPSVVFKREMPKRQIIPWDANRAMGLWQKRHPDTGEQLPDVFTDISDVTGPSEDIRGREKLILKARNIEELMDLTTDDE